MPGIGGPSALIGLTAKPSPLLSLLGAIVVRLTEAGQVGSVEEQRLVALMRDHMVGDRCGGDPPLPLAPLAERLEAELIGSKGFPGSGVVEVTPGAGFG